MFNAVLRADRKAGLASDAGVRNEVGFSLIQVIFIRRITANFKGRPGNRTGRKIKAFTGSLRHAKDNQCLTGGIRKGNPSKPILRKAERIPALSQKSCIHQ